MRLIEALALHPVEVVAPASVAICNPSIIPFGTGWEAVVRGVDPKPYRGPDQPYLSSENWLIRFDTDLHQTAAVQLDDSALRAGHPEVQHGLEDGRLFVWQGQRWILFSGLRRTEAGYLNTMALARLESDGLEGDRLAELTVLPSPRGLPREKNWMPWVIGDALYFVYATDPLEAYALEGSTLRRVSGPDVFRPAKPFASGSSQVIPWGDAYLAVTHTRHLASGGSRLWMKYVRKDPDYKRKKVNFLHQLVLFDAHFKVLKQSQPFSFEADGIEFCAGIAAQDDRCVISYGLMDDRARLVELTRAQVQALLR